MATPRKRKDAVPAYEPLVGDFPDPSWQISWDAWFQSLTSDQQSAVLVGIEKILNHTFYRKVMRFFRIWKTGIGQQRVEL